MQRIMDGFKMKQTQHCPHSESDRDYLTQTNKPKIYPFIIIDITPTLMMMLTL